MESGKYGGRGRWLLMNPPSGNSKPMGTSLLGHPVIPPRYGQVDRYKIQAPIRNKKNWMHIFKGFEDQSDTYHDTRTHYLMEQVLEYNWCARLTIDNITIVTQP